MVMHRYVILGLMMLGVIIGLWWAAPIAQDNSYHHFADSRMMLMIPNALNVLSNLPFLIVGLLAFFRLQLTYDQERYFYGLFFVGVTCVAIGSSYYHWHPDNQRLVYDRLPMTVAFMSLLTAIISERISLKLARYLFIPLILLGVFSIAYWRYTSGQGHGDLSIYVFVQFFPMLALPYMLLAFPARYTGVSQLWCSLVLYVGAKVCELLDKPIYHLTHQWVSGHTIKHLLAALSCYYIYRYVGVRRVQVL